MVGASYFYLHGFASGPRSRKARVLEDRFSARGLRLHVPDLNQGDFAHLTLTRQIQQVNREFPPDQSVVVIGSSFGGLTAAWLGQQVPQVDRLVLLAPAFEFLSHWLPRIEPLQLERWKAGQPLSVYHYGENRVLPLEYSFVLDLAQYEDTALTRSLPTLILHGKQDEVVSVQASRDYAARRPWVELVELNSDHGLGNVTEEIWAAIVEFCGLQA